MRNLLFALAALCVGIACGANSITNVKTGPNTDYPCGVNGVVCLDMNGQPNHMCCGENEACGGGKYEVGCAADMCCFVGSANDFMGVHRPHPQTWEHR